MTQIDEQAEIPVGGEQAEDLEVRIARQLLEQAKAEGVSLVGPGGLLAGVTKTVLQAALDAEMTDHLGYEKGTRPPFPAGNHRNGTSPKTVLTEVGPIPLEVPRDRNGKFEPQIVPKHARRVTGFNQAIVSLYAKGLTTGEIRAHLGEIYGVEVSRDLVLAATMFAHESAAFDVDVLAGLGGDCLLRGCRLAGRVPAVVSGPGGCRGGVRQGGWPAPRWPLAAAR
jgi:Transposase, Mutator family